MKRTCGQSIKQLIKENNMTQMQLARALNVSNSCISSWINDTRLPSHKMQNKLCSYFGVDANYLAGLSESKVSAIEIEGSMVKIPFYFEPNDFICDEAGCDYISVPSMLLDSSCIYFSILCKDTSMTAIGITHGDLVIFNRSNKIKNNQVGCFVIKNNLVVRKFYAVKNKYRLEALDGSLDVIEVKEFNCVGVLTAHLGFKF